MRADARGPAVVVAAVVADPDPRPRIRSATSRSTTRRRRGVRGRAIYVRYALDLAEIPTFQAGDGPLARLCARRWPRGSSCRVDGRRRVCASLEHRVTERPGAGGLKTLRLRRGVRGRAAGRQLVFRDGCLYGSGSGGERSRLGSRRRGDRDVLGAAHRSSSDELRAYPQDLLQLPARRAIGHRGGRARRRSRRRRRRSRRSRRRRTRAVASRR